MTTRTILKLMFLSIILLPLNAGFAQNSEGRWALGFHGGGNLWINDYSTSVVGPGGEVMFRYGIHRALSAGLLVGYEEFKAEQDLPLSGQPSSYLKLHAIPASFVAWAHLAAGEKVNPYIYAGIGAMIYKRLDGAGVYIPNSEFITTIHVPVGVGLEIFASKKASIAVDLGFRVTDDYTDALKAGKLDAYWTAKAGINIYLGSSDADDDDEDGLNNGDEATLGANPINPDTDGDALKDGEEVHQHKTNPNKADSEGDGLNDGDEVTKYKTDPNKADTDGDGLVDGDEVSRKSDPLKTDTDGDGLSDGDEVQKHQSDPLKADTDGDGLTDTDEVQKHMTDPAKSDTDSDGLADGEEVKTSRTDPLKSDTDSGGASDGVEVKRGSNPLDPQDDAIIILEKGKTVVLKGVNFETKKATLTADSEITLEKALNALNASPDLDVLIVGHTDNVGKADYNKDLSLRRAEAVKSWLIKKGISKDRLTVAGKGFDEPIDDNTTTEGRLNNRRIEFRVLQ